MEADFRLPVVAHGQLSEFPGHPEVLEKRAVQLAAAETKKAVALLDRRDYGTAREVLREALATLEEAGPSKALESQVSQLKKMLERLEAGAYQVARKQATFSSVSSSMSSLTLSRGFREFLALPPEERTPERLEQLMNRS